MKKKNCEIWWYWNRKTKIHQHKKTISIKNIDIKKIIVPNRVCFGKKGFRYFTDNRDAEKIRPLCIYLPKMSAHRRDFDETKYISFLVKDSELLEKCNEIWEKFTNSIKIEFYSEPLYNEKISKR